MRIFSLVIASALALTACKDASKDVEKYANDACACKDAPCAVKVMNDFASWAEKNKDARGNEEAAQKAVEKMLGCIQKLDVSQKDLMDFATRLQKLGD